VDVHEHHPDTATKAARIRAHARPWRSIIALALAAVALDVAVKAPFAPLSLPREVTSRTAAVLFGIFALAAAVGLSGRLRDMLEPVLGPSHAAIIRYTLVLIGGGAILIITLQLLHVQIGQLILGGALTGVLIGIAGQQALSNVFAGMVLLFARPFRVGDRVQVRSAALNGPLEGTVAEISVTYVRLATDHGILHLPNSQVLAAAVGPVPQPGSGQSQPGTPPRPNQPGPPARPVSPGEPASR
jgi:small-conductance mechanosensitive channel